MNLSDFCKPKRRIFETAVRLFAEESFETVSMESIASVLDRKKPSIYNHFASKQEILDTALAFFSEHYFDGRRPIEEFIPLIEKGSLLDIVQAISFLFPPDSSLLMQNLLRIVHQRKYFDPAVQKIFEDVVIKESIQYGRDVLDFMVAKGRTAPFDTLSFSTMINHLRMGVYGWWVVNPTPENYTRLVADETKILQFMLLPLEDRMKESPQFE